MLTFIASFCRVCRSVESVVQVPAYVREDSSGRYVKDYKEMGSVGMCGDVWGCVGMCGDGGDM